MMGDVVMMRMMKGACLGVTAVVRGDTLDRLFFIKGCLLVAVRIVPLEHGSIFTSVGTLGIKGKPF